MASSLFTRLVAPIIHQRAARSFREKLAGISTVGSRTAEWAKAHALARLVDVNRKQWTTAAVPDFRPSGRDAGLMAWVFAVMVVGLLPGCAHVEAQKERDALDATVAMATNDDELCRSYGAKPGTPSYVDCRLNLSKQRAAITPTTGR
jgi:hypothetical protein